MRSLHRYASDAMVLTMLLHLLRHFAFDRFSGYRWFSWLTGVLLIGLVYASGINGYMLPWDALAQFVSVTVFEWLDWLPAFGGALMRNFIYPSSVSDRFFSLLSFLHIGLPLFALMLMWVHVQRVPKARTMPPRPIAWGLTLALLALSLALPALSQGGPANLARAVAAVDLDWFYLPLLPAMASWPLQWVWLLLAIGAAVFVTLPWWRRRPRGERAQHRVTVFGAGGTQAQLQVRAGETLLDAGLREGLALPYECRNGACGQCVCAVAQGRIEHHPFQAGALSAEARAQGKALMCCAVPLEDAAIEVETSLRDAASPVVTHEGRVETMEKLAPDVMRLWVALPNGERLPFVAGQYINVVLDDGQRRAFSFASAPHEGARIELHVRLIPGGRFTTHVFERMRAGDSLRFEGPLGSFTLREGERPILLIAAATGFAPIKSIVADAFHRGVRRPMVLYWGVRRPQDLYMQDLAQQWQRERPTSAPPLPSFRFVPVVSEPQPGDHWQGRTGLVHEALLADFPDLSGHEVYVCGSARMVDTAVHDFLAHGLDQNACISDAFAPAARKT
jgi:NAD(P)H-flavin reductase/ferredoxin